MTPVEQLAHSASQAQVDDSNGLDTNVTSQNTGSNTVIIFLSRPMPIRHPWEQLVQSINSPLQTNDVGIRRHREIAGMMLVAYPAVRGEVHNLDKLGKIG